MAKCEMGIKLKKAWIAVIISIILIILVWNIRRDSTSSDWHSVSSFEEMVELATNIVRAEILTLETRQIYRVDVDGVIIGTSTHTFYEILILESFSGYLENGDIIELFQPEVRRIFGNPMMPIQIGDDLVIFLLTAPDHPAGLINPWTGVYRISKNIPTDLPLNESIELTRVSASGGPSVGIEITVEELLNLAYED